MALHSFRRWLVFVVFLFFFVIDVRATEQEDSKEIKQDFLRENIKDAGYDVNVFVEFLNSKKEGGDKIENWTMKELRGVVEEFQKKHQPVNQNIAIQQKENNEGVSSQVNDEESGYQEPEVKLLFNDQVKNEEKISSISGSSQKNDYNVGNEVNNYGQQSLLSSQFDIISKGNEQLCTPENQYGNTVDNNIQSNQSAFGFGNDLSGSNAGFYQPCENEIARGVFDFYRHVGKFLTSLVWSVVNSYCGFEQLVMNDWYCFKYAMCSGYRLQPRFMRSRVWIDMNLNFLEGIAGFLIRFVIFNRSYDMYENIFDFFNVCIDIKVYNNLYFAVNIVGFVRSIVLLSILRDKFINPFLQHGIGV